MVEQLIEGRIGFVFPGQGSQFVGMASQLAAASPAARQVVTEANDLLGFSLSSLMWDGPAETLEDTINAQPAILVASVAAMAAIQERAAEQGKSFVPTVVAGHSLGEFSALAAIGVLSLSDAIRLVRERGRLMKEAGERAPGGMAAVLGLDDETLAGVCAEAAEGQVMVVANSNCPGQTVISGEVAALERAMELAKARGAKRVARLGVSIAAHSPLMAEANRQFGEQIATVTIKEPIAPVIANATAKPLSTADAIRAELMAHMEGPVLWTATIQEMSALGATTLVEIGPGSVLASLNKRINRDLPTLGIADLGLDLPSDTK
jgi:[acyl-carrier-protein] S-malonyltransferase